MRLRNSELLLSMNKFTLLLSFIAFSFSGVNAFAKFPDYEGLRYRVYLENQKCIEISSGIFNQKSDGFNCRLKIKTDLDPTRDTKIKSVRISLNKDTYAIPLDALLSDRAVVAITPIFRINDEYVGFALKFGEGEYAFTRLFRISFSKRKLSYKDLNLVGDVEKSSGLMDMRRVRGLRIR